MEENAGTLFPDSNDPSVNEPAGSYGTQQQYVSRVLPAAEQRQKEVEKALRSAFSAFIEKRQIEVIVFEKMPATQLAAAILRHPVVLKPLLAACNLAGRALKRDLKIDNIDTYEPSLDKAEANAVAGYLLSFLPTYVELPALSRIDRISFIDKEIRMAKGRWEKRVSAALTKFSRAEFKKRKFQIGGQDFELDAASPPTGDVDVGVDVKRIEARQDIHKRCDEIVNKAAKFRAAFAKGRFCAVIYYPFIQDHGNVKSRLESPNIDAVVFASDSTESIENAVRLLLAKVNPKKT